MVELQSNLNFIQKKKNNAFVKLLSWNLKIKGLLLVELYFYGRLSIARALLTALFINHLKT